MLPPRLRVHSSDLSSASLADLLGNPRLWTSRVQDEWAVSWEPCFRNLHFATYETGISVSTPLADILHKWGPSSL